MRAGRPGLSAVSAVSEVAGASEGPSAGPIGFVALTAPQLARRLTRTPSCRWSARR